MSMGSALERVRAVIDEPRLLRLLDYWLSKRPGNRLPGRADIDPIDMPFILGNLILVDIEPDPFRVRYRLVGTNVTSLLGLNATGRYLDEHPDATFRVKAREDYHQVATSGEPAAVRHNTTMDGRVRHYQVLLLPLAADGRRVDMIMVGQCFDMEPPFAG